jgi:hypothetical protein
MLSIEAVRPGISGQRQDFLINWRDTNVALGSQGQFLALEDLRPGDRVEIAYLVEDGRRKAKSVTVEPSEPARR